MHRCLRVGRPRTQGRTVYVTRARRPRTQDGSAPAHPVRAGRSHSQDGTRCTAACGWDARAPRTAAHLRTRCGRDARTPRTVLDAPLPAGGTLALPGRYSMHRCLRAGRPRTQGRTVYVTRARRPRTQGRTVYVTRARRPRTQEGIVSVGIWYYSVSRSSIAVASAGSSACANSHPCPYAHDIERRRIS